MASQFRDTQFGHVVRLLSKRKLFRYPDEIDPSLWKKSLRQDGLPKPAGSEDSRQIGTLKTEKDRPNDDGESNLSHGPPDPQPSQDAIIGHEKDIFFVDWYSPDDPEVGHCYAYTLSRVMDCADLDCRIPKTGRVAGSSLSPCRYVFSTSPFTWEAQYTSLASLRSCVILA